ncbi:MAG TPA: biotin carboxylase N-terminal domain-containing protein [Acidimicrobiia bacterium]|jgi:acetyl/propionyl-CoA carboxylase alpha subunit
MTTPRPITKLLIANRAEIACRIIRTAREMLIPTVAVYSDADAGARHVRLADESVRLPGNTAADTYLRVDALLDAARRTGADAVHPGYGFLSEHAEFARECLDAGLTFVGPPPDAIAAMGNKVEAKARMTAAGVPVLPGVTLDDGTGDDALDAAGEQVGYPVLVKAAFGGGGRGMRVVAEPAALADAVESARREAAAAFGDGLVFLERYVTNPRHIEMQVFADTHGNTVHLFERECSIQRRHQKVIEEAPSVAVDEALRARLGDAAVAAARAIGYVGAGTVEFVMAPNGEFFFLEVNTRLQVEHPVTEMITGLDLVRLQLEVAGGAPLPPEALAPERHGHAVEARLVAEDVPTGFLPTSGRYRALETGEGNVGGVQVRVDTGYESGDSVSTFYDALLAKVIAWAPTRDVAASALAHTLRRARLHGPRTNRDLLVRTLEHPEFVAGAIDTAFYERHDPSELGRPLADSELVDRLAIAAALARATSARTALAVPYGWRNTAPGWVTTTFTGDADRSVSVRQARDGTWHARVGDDGSLHDVALEPERLQIDGVTMHVSVDRLVGETWVDSEHGNAHLVDVSRFPPPESSSDAGSLHSPLPGTVVRVDVAVGDTVHAGAPLVVLEAMKMEHTIRAPHDGVVSELDVAVGTQVETGAVLVVVVVVAEAG